MKAVFTVGQNNLAMYLNNLGVQSDEGVDGLPVP